MILKKIEYLYHFKAFFTFKNNIQDFATNLLYNLFY